MEQAQRSPLADLHEAHGPLTESQAVIEAQACLQCGGPHADAPCVRACPTRIDIPGFIADLAHRDPVEAARKIYDANILGGSCARVCPVEVLCQGSCVLLKEGRRAIQIGRLQRHATDRAPHAIDFNPARTARPRASVGVIGAGPSGLSCAAMLVRDGFAVTLYEQRELGGGLISHAIAPYKQLIDPLPLEIENIRRLGVEFQFGVTICRDISVQDLRSRHHAIFLGVGMGEDLPARIPGEDLPGVWESLPFVEALKLGPAGLLQVGRSVAVIGGGNTAIDAAREAVLLGASEVMMLYRRTQAQMPAYPHEIAAAMKEGVRILELVAPVQFKGLDRVRAVRCLRMKLGEPDASGRPRPEPIPGSEFEIEVDTVIKAIGQKPRTELFKLFGIDLTDGRVRVDKEMRTSAPGIYAGGDCLNGGATVVEAVRDGKVAAKAISQALSGSDRAETPPPPVPRARIIEDHGTFSHFQGDFRLSTVPVLCKGCNICVTSCPTHTLKLDNANRIAVKDVNDCVFCGLCEVRCPDFAIFIAKTPSRPRAESEQLA
ncbi:glutamate synthase (NADPH/NADH) small chain [Phycisphaerales bacterium]|nr:glutamate synthase (NADPH/NADH) small chain [Phycisphaerales bacterium]